jgi:N12 class adenine-specific DNA methylase
MFRKLRAGEKPSGPAWKAAVDYTGEQKEKFSLNEYFVTHPEMMLGKMRLARGMYRDGEPVLLPDGRDLEKALAEAVERLPQNIYQAEKPRVAAKVAEVNIPAPDFIKPNAFCVHEDDKLRPLDDTR